MKFYIPSVSKENLIEALDIAKKSNFGIEIMDFVDPQLLNNKLYIKDLVKLLDSFNGNISIHAPFYDLNFISIDHEIKEVTLKRYNQVIETAIALKTKNIVFHIPYIPDIKVDFYRDYFIKSMIEFWNDFIKLLESAKIVALLENTYEPDPEIFKNIVTEVNSSNLKLCLDVGHSNINSKIEIKDWIKCFGNDLHYMHLHSNNGIYDDHDSLLNGNIDFKELFNFLKTLNLSPELSFEIFSEPKLVESIEHVNSLTVKKSS